MTTSGTVTELRLGDGATFHTTSRSIRNDRTMTVGGSTNVLMLWSEVQEGGALSHWYAISLDGTNVDEVRETSYELGLRFARFDPNVASPAVPANLTADADGELYIVQFVTQPLASMRAAIVAAGATIYDYLPHHAYVIRASTQTRAVIQAFPLVHAVVPYHPAYRLEEYLLDRLDLPGALDPQQRYNVLVLEPSQKGVVGAKITAIGGVVDSPDAGKRLLWAALTAEQILEVAAWNEVAFVDRWSPMVPDMDIVRQTCGANDLEAISGYQGSGVRGEVLDMGFNLMHLDFAASPNCELADPNTRCSLIAHGPLPIPNGHGAATAGIIFGNGTASLRGLLPMGQGIVAYWGVNYEFLGAGSNRYAHTGELVNVNLAYKAVFQSTSGGSLQLTTAYTTISQEMDQIAFDFDLVHCQSQANAGGGPFFEPPIPSSMSGAQAWAKNVISVGGVKHWGSAGTADDKWCGVHGCNTSPYYCGSTGPAGDGRIKPDLAYFFDCVDTVGCCGLTDDYPGFGGTSAAAPVICGLAGLIFEMWADDSDHDGKNIFVMPVPTCVTGDSASSSVARTPARSKRC